MIRARARRPAPAAPPRPRRIRAGTLWRLALTVNGKKVRADVPPLRTLLDFLRLDCGLTGTKGACLEGECGSCYVILDGRPVNACLILAPQAAGRSVVTIEGLADGRRLDSLQEAFLACGAVQCGYCTPGLILAARALLDRNPDPTRQELLTALEGNICRCTGYDSIVRAVETAADTMRLRR